MIRDLFTKGGKALYAYKGLYIDKKQPVLVYAPGRVGSMGLIKNLRDAGVFSFKVESFEKEKRGTTKFVKKHIIEAQHKANIITLVRDPVEIMCSYFFSKAGKGWIHEARQALGTKDVTQLQKIFIDEILSTKRLDSHLYWFENDCKKFLKIDVFQYPFDTKEKYSFIQDNAYTTLILRTDMDDLKKSKLIEKYFDCSDILVTRENSRQTKANYDLYKEFKNTLKIPSNILEKIYTSPYTTHFYSDKEIRDFIKKWSKN